MRNCMEGSLSTVGSVKNHCLECVSSMFYIAGTKCFS